MVHRLLGHRGATLPVKLTHALHPLASNTTSVTSRNILMTNGTSVHAYTRVCVVCSLFACKQRVLSTGHGVGKVGDGG